MEENPKVNYQKKETTTICRQNVVYFFLNIGEGECQMPCGIFDTLIKSCKCGMKQICPETSPITLTTFICTLHIHIAAITAIITQDLLPSGLVAQSIEQRTIKSRSCGFDSC